MQPPSVAKAVLAELAELQRAAATHERPDFRTALEALRLRAVLLGLLTPSGQSQTAVASDRTLTHDRQAILEALLRAIADDEPQRRRALELLTTPPVTQ